MVAVRPSNPLRGWHPGIPGWAGYKRDVLRSKTPEVLAAYKPPPASALFLCILKNTLFFTFFYDFLPPESSKTTTQHHI
jgi:hypothetical protein